MDGEIIQVVPKRNLDFTTLGVGDTQQVVLADRVDIVQWREVTMMVMVHNHSLANGAGTINIWATPESRSAEDPGLTFLYTSVTPGTLIDGSKPSPTYLTKALAGFNAGFGGVINFGDMLRVMATGSRVAAGAITATISVNISGKDG